MTAFFLLLFVAGAVLLLATLIRFSAVSSWRRRGAENRLLAPNAREVEGECGFPPSLPLLELYRNESVVKNVEFCVVDTSKSPEVRWFIGGFNPLSAVDLREVKATSGLRDVIPIADDLDGGIYYVARDDSVWLKRPDEDNSLPVAPSVAAFAKFDIVE